MSEKIPYTEIMERMKLDIDYIAKEAYAKGFEMGKQVGSAEAGAMDYQKGLDDAWEAARKLFSSMADSDIEKAFPIEWNNGGFKALMNLQPQEAIAKLTAYEEKKKADSEIKVGDEIEDYDGSKYVVEYIDLSEKCIYAVRNDGHTFGFHGINVCKVKKTGRHFPEVADLLKKMKGGAE